MTIYEIKRRTSETAPFFFSCRTMKWFGQTLKDFTVKKQSDGRYLITAPRRNIDGVSRGETVRYFNPKNNELETFANCP